ncbi:MAG: hypothetical protein ABIW85_01810 [Variovorax sp.]
MSDPTEEALTAQERLARSRHALMRQMIGRLEGKEEEQKAERRHGAGALPPVTAGSFSSGIAARADPDGASRV